VRGGAAPKGRKDGPENRAIGDALIGVKHRSALTARIPSQILISSRGKGAESGRKGAGAAALARAMPAGI
jgi:hypothetical protein